MVNLIEQSIYIHLTIIPRGLQFSKDWPNVEWNVNTFCCTLSGTVKATLHQYCLVGLVVKAPASRAEILGSNPACDGIFQGQVIPVT